MPFILSSLFSASEEGNDWWKPYNQLHQGHRQRSVFPIKQKCSHCQRGSKVKHFSKYSVGSYSVSLTNIYFVFVCLFVCLNDDFCFTSVMLPYHNGGVKVEKSQVYTKLESKLGFTVMWNDEDSVLVKIKSSFIKIISVWV